jgi:hypothetical protein
MAVFTKRWLATVGFGVRPTWRDRRSGFDLRRLRADPVNADAHYHLTMIACQQTRFATVPNSRKKALNSEVCRAPAHVMLGRALSALGRNAQALFRARHHL